MISAGTARRSIGSAMRRRRYVGLAIDCARPLMESERDDALATPARAIDGLRSDFPCHSRKDVPHQSESARSYESMRDSLSRVCVNIFLSVANRIRFCFVAERALDDFREIAREAWRRFDAG